MKIIADTIPKANEVLLELMTFMGSAKELSEAAAPYSLASNNRVLPRFIAETSQVLKNSLIKDFGLYFPNLLQLIEDGSGTQESIGRLHNACYIFNEAQRKVNGLHCVIKDDDTREEIYEQFRTVVGDIVVYICIQFGLYNLDSGEVQLAVSKYCERSRITPDIFYGILCQMLEDVERSWWAYEVMSPVYKDLCEFDPAFVTECEESMYPLTDDYAKKIISGEIDIAVARGMLMQHLSSTVSQEVDVTPASLISRMKLE